MVRDWILNKVLDQIKETTGIERYDGTKILNDADVKLPDDIIFKNIVILMTSVIKDGNKFYLQLVLELSLSSLFE